MLTIDELGGKSANIVFADTDLETCVESSVFATYDNAGQDCCSRSRILVERPVFEEFVERFSARTGAIVVGDPADEATEMGPLITPDHLSTVSGYLDIADGEGARRVRDGERPGGALATGSYLTPVGYVDVRDDIRVMQEEVFGSVVGIMAFDDEDEAVRLANDSPNGLSGVGMDARHRTCPPGGSSVRYRYDLGELVLEHAYRSAIRGRQGKRDRPRTANGGARALQRTQDGVHRIGLGPAYHLGWPTSLTAGNKGALTSETCLRSPSSVH